MELKLEFVEWQKEKNEETVNVGTIIARSSLLGSCTTNNTRRSS